MNTKNRFHYIGFHGITVWVLLQFVALSSMLACGEVTPYDSYSLEEEGEPMAGKSDGSFKWEDPLPTLNKAYWLTGESRVLVADLNDDGDGELVSYFSGLAFPVQDGESVTMSFRPCDIVLPEIAGRDLEFGKEALYTAGSKPTEGGLIRAQDGDGWELWTADAVMVVGAKLDDPDTDALPTSKHDPNVYDVDRDGKPGVTIHSGSFQVYGAFRFRIAVTAQMNEDGVFAGDSLLQVDQQLYGDNIPFYNAVNAAEEALEDWVVLDTSHSVNLAPIPLNEATCVGRDVPKPIGR